MTEKKTIFMAQYRLPFPVYGSGADISNLTFLDALHQRGFKVETLFCTVATEPLELIQTLLEKRGVNSTLKKDVLKYKWKSLDIVITTDTQFFSLYGERLKENQADWIWHHNQFFNCPTLKQFTQTPHHVKHFAYIQSENALELLSPIYSDLDLLISNSLLMKKIIMEKWGIKSKTIYPVPKKKNYSIDLDNKQSHYITFINPVKEKGAEIVFNLVQRFPDKDFLIVLGWHGILPEEWDFTQFENVTIHPVTLDMKVVYSVTRLLLIPSLWVETFGRVQIEAAMVGVPSIISNRGALPEVFEGNGVCINDYENSVEWEKAIHQFDDVRFYNQAVENCKQVVEKYSFEKEVDKFEKSLLHDG